MKKIFFITFLLVGFCTFSQNTTTTKSDGKFDLQKYTERMYVGGELGLTLSQSSAYIMVAPLLGYDITETFSAGISTMYQVYYFNQGAGNSNSFNTVGAGAFARLRPIAPLLLQLEFDLYNTNNFADGSLDRVNVPAFMAGIGYARAIRDRSYFQAMLLYDFINNPNMPIPQIVFPALHLKLGLIWHLGD